VSWWNNRSIFDYTKPGVSDKEQTNRHFGFSRIIAGPHYSKYPECLLELFFLEHYGAPGNSSSDFVRPGVCHWLLGGKNEGLKIRGNYSSLCSAVPYRICRASPSSNVSSDVFLSDGQSIPRVDWNGKRRLT
jgi:hypothetical protein